MIECPECAGAGVVVVNPSVRLHNPAAERDVECWLCEGRGVVAEADLPEADR